MVLTTSLLEEVFKVKTKLFLDKSSNVLRISYIGIVER
jgi:hypothetical protein